MGKIGKMGTSVIGSTTYVKNQNQNQNQKLVFLHLADQNYLWDLARFPGSTKLQNQTLQVCSMEICTLKNSSDDSCKRFVKQ